ncbi:hypothetical protein AGLY_010146 [Aphis glycines]|uniref:Uncharacterized protein n=1 Tax=Aphis glycines TaxID=307491 RepID=A0A6G0THD4_APHGL|nr:hypothetical protein AGLY_010146 [Aphis glycines]
MLKFYAFGYHDYIYSNTCLKYIFLMKCIIINCVKINSYDFNYYYIDLLLETTLEIENKSIIIASKGVTLLYKLEISSIPTLNIVYYNVYLILHGDNFDKYRARGIAISEIDYICTKFLSEQCGLALDCLHLQTLLFILVTFSIMSKYLLSLDQHSYMVLKDISLKLINTF